MYFWQQQYFWKKQLLLGSCLWNNICHKITISNIGQSLRPIEANKTINLHFTIRGKLYINRCDKKNYFYSPLYSGKQMERGEWRIFSSNRSLTKRFTILVRYTNLCWPCPLCLSTFWRFLWWLGSWFAKY